MSDLGENIKKERDENIQNRQRVKAFMDFIQLVGARGGITFLINPDGQIVASMAIRPSDKIGLIVAMREFFAEFDRESPHRPPDPIQ